MSWYLAFVYVAFKFVNGHMVFQLLPHPTTIIRPHRQTLPGRHFLPTMWLFRTTQVSTVLMVRHGTIEQHPDLLQW